MNSPLQYLLARTIAEHKFPADDNHLLQYIEGGDFGAVFAQIDRIIGENHFATWRKWGEFDPGVEYSRLFLSNRYNPIECEIRKAMVGRFEKLCAFEDGFATYLKHSFRDPDVHDWSFKIFRRKWRETIRAKLDNVIGTRKARLDLIVPYIPAYKFSAIYSVLPHVPAYPFTVRRHAIREEFQATCAGPPAKPKSGSQCVFLGQSLVADGLVNDEIYRTITRDALRTAIGRYETVFFKRHPREHCSIEADAAALGCLPLPEPFDVVPVELYLARNPGTDVIGFWSTTLIYAPIVGARAFTAGHLLARERPDTRDIMRAWQYSRKVLDRAAVRRFEI